MLMSLKQFLKKNLDSFEIIEDADHGPFVEKIAIVYDILIYIVFNIEQQKSTVEFKNK